MPVMPPRQIACSGCALQPLCDVAQSVPRDVPAVDCRLRLSRGEVLFEEGSPQIALYAVRAGFLKSCASGHDGKLHILRFLLPGDAAGLEGFGARRHASRAVALDDCEVCEISLRRAQVLADSFARVAADLRSLLAVQLAQSQAHATALATLTAPQRLAAFLVELSRRWRERGYSAHAFRLPMDRREIGEHLGMTIETVSRILSDFKARGWVRVSGRAVEILDPEALRHCPSLTS